MLRPPPPTPLTDNHFAKKPLADTGEPPPLMDNPQIFFYKKWVKKG